jgi:hypothetical protein
MEPLLKNLLWDTAKQLALTLLLLAPALAAACHLRLVRLRYRRKALEPFTSAPLRPPGESLRLKVTALDEKISDELLVLLGLPCFLAAVFTATSRTPPPLLAVLLLGITLFVLWRYRRLRATVQDFWNHRLGFDGERVVGEELNQLMLEGYRVFHDLPCGDFNIDHVIVGASGIYAVETKTRRKPIDEKGRKLEWTVTYDGNQLLFPRSGPDRSWLEQAVRSAQHLSKWLTAATGEATVALPVLVIPGWLIERRAVGTVRVLNEKEVRYSFPKSRALSPGQIQRVVHQLSEKCRLSG